MLRTSKTSSSLREIARANYHASEATGSSVLPAFLKGKNDVGSWLQLAEDGMFPNLGLHRAAATGNVGLAKYALENGQPPTSVLNGLLPLHAACSGGNETIVLLLLRHGADVNATRQPSDGRATPEVESEGSTPLHFAAANGHMQIIRLLLESGADPTVQDQSGRTPEMLAALHRFPECASFIRSWMAARATDTANRYDTGVEGGSRGWQDEVKSKATLRKERSLESIASLAKSSMRKKRNQQKFRQALNAQQRDKERSKRFNDMAPMPDTPSFEGMYQLEIAAFSRSKGKPEHVATHPGLERRRSPAHHNGNDISNSAVANSTDAEHPGGESALKLEDDGDALSESSNDRNALQLQSASFLPSLNSSTDSLASNFLQRQNSDSTDGQVTREDRRQLERSQSDSIVKPDTARPFSITSSSTSKDFISSVSLSESNSNSSASSFLGSLPHDNLAMPSSMDESNDAQELLRGSLDIASPKIAGKGLKSGQHDNFAPTPLSADDTTEEINARSKPSAGEWRKAKLGESGDDTVGRGLQNDERARNSEVDLSHSNLPMKNQDKSLCDTPKSAPPARHNYSFSIASAPNGKSIDSLASRSSDSPSLEQTRSLVESAEAGIRATSRAGSRSSLSDMLAAYGEALAMQRRATGSTPSLASKASLLSISAGIGRNEQIGASAQPEAGKPVATKEDLRQTESDGRERHLEALREAPSPESNLRKFSAQRKGRPMPSALQNQSFRSGSDDFASLCSSAFSLRSSSEALAVRDAAQAVEMERNKSLPVLRGHSTASPLPLSTPCSRQRSTPSPSILKSRCCPSAQEYDQSIPVPTSTSSTTPKGKKNIHSGKAKDPIRNVEPHLLQGSRNGVSSDYVPRSAPADVEQQMFEMTSSRLSLSPSPTSTKSTKKVRRRMRKVLSDLKSHVSRDKGVAESPGIPL